MVETTTGRICADCGKSLSNKGSMTQWIGLGEYCHCKIAKRVAPLENFGHSEYKRKKRCGLCRKQKNSRNQSMTQWLFQADICTCAPEASEDISLSSPVSTHAEGLSGFSKISETRKKICASLAGVLVFATAFVLYLCFEPDGKSIFARKSSEMHGARYALASRSNEFLTYRILLDSSGCAQFEECLYDTLSISNVHLSEVDLETVARMQGLRNLSLNGVRGMSSHKFKQLRYSPTLRTLEIDEMYLTKSLCEQLSEFQLRKLELNRCNIDDDGALPIIRSKIPEIVLASQMSQVEIAELQKFRKQQGKNLYVLKTSK